MRWWWNIVFLAALSVLILQTIDYLNFAIDDVFITLRVVENLVHGNGFVYNPGEFVEGYSNWLWVVLLSVPAASSMSQPATEFGLLWAAKALSYAFALGTISLTFFLTRRLLAESNLKHMFSAVSVLALVSCAPFVLWSLSGMETLACAFFFTLAVYLLAVIFSPRAPYHPVHARLYVALGFVLALASLTRPEPVLHAGLAFAFLAWKSPSHERKRGLLYSVLPFVIIMSGFLTWRWLTYDDLLPNTFYAKTGGGLRSLVLGSKYLLAGLAAIAGPLLLFLPFAPGQARKQQASIQAIGIFVAASVIFSVYSGGDWMPGFRFLVPVAPMLLVAAVIGLHNVFIVVRQAGLLTAIPHWAFAAFLFIAVFSTAFYGRTMIRGQIPQMATGLRVIRGHALPVHYRVAKWLQKHTNGPFSVATGEAGLIGYLNPELRLLDCNGLMDKNIARIRKAGGVLNVDYFLDQEPDYVILPGLDVPDPALVDPTPSGAYVDAFLNSPRFQASYRLVQQYSGTGIYARTKD